MGLRAFMEKLRGRRCSKRRHAQTDVTICRRWKGPVFTNTRLVSVIRPT